MHSPALAIVVALSALGAGTAAATPFEARTIPDQVDAIGHVDVDALRRTQLFGALGGQAALDAVIDDAPVAARGIARSLSRSIRGVSFWYDDDHGALQVATSDARALAQLLGKLPMKQARAIDGHGVFVLDQGGQKLQLAAVGATLVLSNSAESLDRAVRVLGGKARSLAGTNRLPSVGRQGVFFVAALGDDLLGKIQRNAKSRLMQLSAKSLVVDVSEGGGQVTATARAEMTTADALRNAKSIVEGLRALGSLSDEPGVATLLDGVSVSTKGLVLEVNAKAAVADLAKLIRVK